MKLAIYGAGGVGEVILDRAKRINKKGVRWDDIFFVDDTGKTEVCKTRVYPFEMIQRQSPADELRFLVALGEPMDRELVANRIEAAGFQLDRLICVDEEELPETAEIEAGAILLDRTITIAPFAHIGKNALIQGYTSIAHGTEIGDHSNVSPYCMICGNCKIGKTVFVGAHASIKEKTCVCDHAIIGMGAIVTRDVPENHTVFATPSKMVAHEPGTKALQGEYMN